MGEAWVNTRPMQRKYPIGAEFRSGQGTHFRVWAPASAAVSVEPASPAGSPGEPVPLGREPNGYFSGNIPSAGPGFRYRFRLDSGSFPDPASRFQPEGPHGPSEVVDPSFSWSDAGWRGLAPRKLVIYELHLGTFTAEGTWGAAAEHLPELARIGITAVEIMPVADFPGRFGWGYDGVNLFAPCRLYGRPEDFRAFVNRAHDLNVAVILDVVYNHFGPDGNYLTRFSPNYFNDEYACEWGQAVNFDGADAPHSREFFLTNAAYWIDEFHLDGLRLDATQQIFDKTSPHILAEIASAARAAGRERTIYIVAENESQESRLVRPVRSGGYGLDAVWNDDFHHAAIVAATGHAEAYYLDYRGSAQEFVSAVKYGYLFQGQWHQWQQKRRGTPALDLAPENFVAFIENHDQVSNNLRGQRLHELTSPGRFRALTALVLLAPSTPLLFQGQEFAASTSFTYFADHGGDLAEKIRVGRAKFMQQFRSAAAPGSAAALPNPCDEATFLRCKLDHAERERNASVVRLHQDLLTLRRKDPVLSGDRQIDGAVLAERAFAIRYSGAAGDRLLIVNLGPEFIFNPAPEPLLAPVEDSGWQLVWSSENPLYWGRGTSDLETTANWIIPGEAAVFLAPDEQHKLPAARLTQDH